MCLLLTRHYKCYTRDGQAVNPQSHPPRQWIQPCSSPLIVTREIRAGTAQQPCLSALDTRDEYYNHPCPECTGGGVASDGKPYVIETDGFDYAASGENKRAYDHAVHNFAIQLVKLYYAWIDDHWRGGVDGPESQLPERAAIVVRELACREDASHRARDPESGLFCCCLLTACPLLNNFASQRRFDMALQCCQSHVEEGRDSGGAWATHVRGVLRRARDDAGNEYEAISAWMTTRSPAVMSVVRPFGRGELQMRRDQLESMVAGVGTADVERIDSGPRCIYHVVANMREILALDTGLTLERAKAILGVIRDAMMLDGVPSETAQAARSLSRESGFDLTWTDRLFELLAENAPMYWKRERYEMDFLLGDGDRPIEWGWWNSPVSANHRLGLMEMEWFSHIQRHRQRLQEADRNIVDLDAIQIGPDARCAICGNDFTSNEAPFDVPATPDRCAGTHSEGFGRRCLLYFASTTTNVPFCPICRRPYCPTDGEAAA